VIKFHKIKFSLSMISFLTTLFFFQSMIFLVLSAPLHSKLIRPKVQEIVKFVLEMPYLRVCGVDVHLFLLCFAYCVLQCLLHQQNNIDPLIWSNLMIFWCIVSYYKLRCKYEYARNHTEENDKKD
jgi:hypothetical protein